MNNTNSELINKLIDHRSEDLWQMLSEATTIDVIAQDRVDYMVSRRADHYTIFVSNCLEHIKMLPIYLEMGFERKDFISDYNIEKLSQQDYNKLRKVYYKDKRDSTYNLSAVDYFIGKYFGVKACPNETFNYPKITRRLKELDLELVNAIDKFIEEWKSIDLDSTKNIQPIVTNFEKELELWSRGKIFL